MRKTLIVIALLLVSCAPKAITNDSNVGSASNGVTGIDEHLKSIQWFVDMFKNKATQYKVAWDGITYHATESRAIAVQTQTSLNKTNEDIKDLERQIVYHVGERIAEHNANKWLGWKTRSILGWIIGIGFGAIVAYFVTGILAIIYGGGFYKFAVHALPLAQWIVKFRSAP